MRLKSQARKWWLVGHIVSAGLWIGIDAVLGILVCTALLTDDPAVRTTGLEALGLFAVWPMFTTALLTLTTGAVLGLGSKYGLVRYWWVAAKLAVNVLMAVLILFALRPGVDVATEQPEGLLYPVVVAPALLLFASVLAVFKPWGRLRKESRDPSRGNDLADEALRTGRRGRGPEPLGARR
ncbi:hypothetical protein [Amycolatopsis lexingtonensis]|uniref:hypothetical protein n=1 Tax=Amycolatopsis lexingtonensis TaxID=218822 RepID=UPI003F7289F2